MIAELHELWRAEKSQSQLQKLPENFFGQVSRYIQNLRNEVQIAESKSLAHRVASKELKVATRLIGEILDARIQKIIHSLLQKAETGSLALDREESAAVEKMRASIQAYFDLKGAVLEGVQWLSDSEEVHTEKIAVRILKDLPAIVGVDLKTYGPFKPEDVATIPSENAAALISQGYARRIDASITVR